MDSQYARKNSYSPFRLSLTIGLAAAIVLSPPNSAGGAAATCPLKTWMLQRSLGRFDREIGWVLSVDNAKKGNEFWTYDNDGRISRLACTNSFGRSIEISYNYSGRHSVGYDITTPSGAIFSHRLARNQYRPDLVDRISVTFSAKNILDREFEYNALNKATRWHDSVSSANATYTYNRRGEIAQATVNGIRYAYGFDASGNCINFAIGTVTNLLSVNSRNQCTALNFPDINGTTPLEYDQDGNLSRAPGMFLYRWDCANRLISVTTPDSTVSNRYDCQNRLVRQDKPGLRRYCIFNRWNLLFEQYCHDSGQTDEVEYFWGTDKSGTMHGACGVGGLIAVCKRGKFYFPYYGINGDILGYVNEDGDIVAAYAYGPFGELASAIGSMANSFQFRMMTKRYDEDLRLYDFGSRWYSVALRRWICRDPLGENGGINLYAFCENDPVNKFDPNGCIPLDTLWDVSNIIYDIAVGDEVALAADTAALFVPYVPAGASRLVKSARLSEVEKICAGASKLDVTYQYLPARLYNHGRHTLPPGAAKSGAWIIRTKNQPAKFLPGWSDTQIKALIEEAFSEAKRQGKIKPQQLDGFVYDAKRTVGASDGRLTTRIKIHINSDGRNLHAFPY